MPAIVVWKCHNTLTFCSLLKTCTIPCACHAKHGVHFFDISTSKSGPSMVCFVHFDLEMRFAPQRRALFRHLNLQKWHEHVVFCTFWLGNVLRATTACTFSTSQLPKVVRAWCALCILTWKCASRHNGVHFFDIATSKSGPSMVWFVNFDLEMCFAPQRRALFRHLNFQKWHEHVVFCTFWLGNVFAPQRRALFRHLNFQKWSEHGVFCTFWLGNVLRATTACTFSTSQLPKVVRACCVLYILTWKCASRHNGVHFFDISTSKSGPSMVCFVHFDLEMCFAPQRRALFRHLNLQKWHEHVVFCTFWLGNVLRATTACTFSTSQLPKVVRAWCALHILTWKCASRHNGVHFFDIATSKSGPSMVCFAHFDLEMCFAPQRRALFRHLNFQKWPEHGVFCTFWLGNVLRATTARTFSTSQLPKVVRAWCVLYILTWKCASRHNGVHFFDISTSKSGPSMVCFVHFDLQTCFAPQRRAIFHLSSGQLALRIRRFSDPTFRPSGAPNHWKNTVFRDFPTFSRICICFLLTLSLLFFLLVFLFSLPLPFSAFHLSILSEVRLLNFLRWADIFLHWSQIFHCGFNQIFKPMTFFRGDGARSFAEFRGFLEI